MNIETELKAFKKKLDPKIAAYFDRAIQEAKKEDIFVADALRYSKSLVLAGGKRLRSAFMYYGYIGVGGNDESAILDASMSIEMIHSCLLIHDDIIDQDDMRHGIKTIHRHYKDIGDTLFLKRDTKHFGDSIALVIGDMFGAFGNDIIFSSHFPLEQKFQALLKLQTIVAYTVIGQIRDVYIEYSSNANEEEILSMYRNKTAKYTIEGPLHLGALLGGASEDILSGFSNYSIPLGIAFQIQDDILGIFGDEKRLGKPVGSDIAEGKITLLVSRVLRDGTKDEKKRLRHILSLGTELRKQDIEEFRTIIHTSGAFESTKKMAHTYIEESKQALMDMKGKIDERAYNFLFSVADYMTKREY